MVADVCMTRIRTHTHCPGWAVYLTRMSAKLPLNAHFQCHVESIKPVGISAIWGCLRDSVKKIRSNSTMVNYMDEESRPDRCEVACSVVAKSFSRCAVTTRSWRPCLCEQLLLWAVQDGLRRSKSLRKRNASCLQVNAREVNNQKLLNKSLSFSKFRLRSQRNIVSSNAIVNVTRPLDGVWGRWFHLN